MPHADWIILHAAQLVTCASPNGPKRGAALSDVGLIEDGALAISGGRIVGVGPSAEIRAQYTAERTIDVSGKVVCPGFVDAHTHAVWGGDRYDEFERKLRGDAYLDILAAGGGILSTVRETRAASFETLVELARARLRTMLHLGTTTVEIKTGYGLDIATELKMLAVIEAMAHTEAVDLVPTFLGAHAVPNEYRGRADDYVTLVIEEMLPAAADWYANSVFAEQERRFCADVFCEEGAFDVAQTRRVLEAARALRMGARVHADEFNALGGTALAVELRAMSADHLDVTPPEENALLAASDTVAVVMPAVNFHLGNAHYADARALIEAGAVVALATDLNPGSAPCYSLPLVMALACRMQGLLPAEALNACTINAAHALGMGSDVGSLEVGKQADVLILDTADYRALAGDLGVNHVDTVIKRGAIVSERGTSHA